MSASPVSSDHSAARPGAPTASNKADIVIVGGGILGCATALRLSRRGLRVTVIEKEGALASHQTGHNSGVVHAGLYYKPGSLKARMCAEGREQLIDFCETNGVQFERCGKIIVALNDAELPRLDELERRGRANGLTGIRRLRAEELHEFEPSVAGIAGLHVPETGIVDYKAVTAAYARAAANAGTLFVLDANLIGVERNERSIIAKTTQGEFQGRCFIACAGLGCDRVAKLAGAETGIKIVPFRGEYYELVEHRRSLVKNLIYPVPDPAFPFLGVHFTRRITGQIEAGPNAVLALRREGYRRTSFSFRDAWEIGTFSGTWHLAAKHWRTGFGEMWRSWSKAAFVAALSKLVPDVRASDLVEAGAGVRAQAMRADGSLVDDFAIIESERMVHVINAPSPAATASLAIAMHIEERALAHLA